MEDNVNEVIDLTQSFTFCRAPINLDLSCSVIELDDSISVSPRPSRTQPPAEPIACDADILPDVSVCKKSQAKKKKRLSRTSVPATSSERERSPNLGDCPICRDRLGTNPMASTKCGHVYCLSCIDQAVKIEKKCPTCRKPLRGATAFHPLFL